MHANIVVLLALLSLTGLTRLALHFYRNLEACKASGIPYVCIPFHPHSVLANLLFPVWGPLLALLPASQKGTWYTFMRPALLWDELYAPFRQVGSNTVLTCAPSCVMLHTAAADVISQITARRDDFPKPVEAYKIIDIYGKSAISVEGRLWKKHRKITAGSFTERNNRVVWSESIHQAQQLLLHIISLSATSSTEVRDVENLTSRAALAIISKAGFGVSVEWPRSNEKSSSNDEENIIVEGGTLSTSWVNGKTNSHQMSYAEAIFSVSTDVFWLFVFSRSLLKYFPFGSARRAAQAYVEWSHYMREMIAAKREELDSQNDMHSPGADLLANLIKGADDTRTYVKDQSTNSGTIGVEGFSDDEILGNAFLMIMAGHETTAGNLHIALLLLAMHVDSQRRLQSEIDAIFQGKPPSEWIYERDFPRAFNSMPGAVMSETLRWMPPVVGIPKWSPSAQEIMVSGTKCMIPRNTRIALNVPAAHRNPSQWPQNKPQRPQDLEYAPSNSEDDLGEFSPERWLHLRSDESVSQERQTSSQPANLDANDHHLRYASGTPPGLYRPARGAYLPFSEGGRACLGRRFSQVEVVAMLAVIFQKYSVELATEEWASDAEIDVMGESQRCEVWRQARASAKCKLRTKMQALMTNRLTNARVPVRLVRRGHERFAAAAW